jgi:hypothetical protein
LLLNSPKCGNHAHREGIHTLRLLGTVDKFVMRAEFAEKSRRIDQPLSHKLSLSRNSCFAPSKEIAIARLLAFEVTSLYPNFDRVRVSIRITLGTRKRKYFTIFTSSWVGGQSSSLHLYTHPSWKYHRSSRISLIFIPVVTFMALVREISLLEFSLMKKISY